MRLHTFFLLAAKVLALAIFFSVMHSSPAHADRGLNEKPRKSIAGFYCEKNLAPAKYRGKKVCRPCGKKHGQPACEKRRVGPTCGNRLVQVGSTCKSCGGRGEKACPKAEWGYPCEGKMAPDSRGICNACGGRNQAACRAGKSGEQCNSWLNKDSKNICRPCGGKGQKSCPVSKRGSICKSGLGRFDGKCQSCGELGERACPAAEQGRQCEEWSTERNGFCKACGTPSTGACRVTDQGKACQDIYSYSFGQCKETVRSRTRAKALERLKTIAPNILADALGTAETIDRSPAIQTSLKNGEEPSAPLDNRACFGDEHQSWTIGVGAGASAIVGVEGEVGAAMRCAEHQRGQKDMKWYSGGAWSINAGGDASAGVNVGMWMAPYNNLRGKYHGVVFSISDIIGAYDAYKNGLDMSKLKKASADVSIGFYFEDNNGWPGNYSGFTVALSGGVGLNAAKYVKGTTVQNCDYDMDCALHQWRQKGNANGTRIDVKARDKRGITVDIYAPGEDARRNVYFERHTITDKRDYQLGKGRDAERICFRHNFKELRYLESGRNCDRGIALVVEGQLNDSNETFQRTRASGDSANPVQINATSTAISVLGLWDFDARGTRLTDEFVQQTDTHVVLRRNGGNQLRRYEKTGPNSYRAESGATVRFVSSTRGIWISPDGRTVYQLRKR